MARSPTKQSQRADVNTFVGGLITEASPLNFPPNASFSEENFELNRDGTRDRRRGMGLEVPHNIQATILDAGNFPYSGVNSYVWGQVGGVSAREVLVIQTRNVLFFYNTQVESISFPGPVASLTIGGFPTDVNYGFAAIDGKLVVASGSEELALITLGSDNVASYSTFRLRVRDVWGIETFTSYDSEMNYRGTEEDTPDSQIYNLQNQSWGLPRRNYVLNALDPFGFGAIMRDPLDYFQSTHAGRWPSNAETVYGGLQFTAGSANDVPNERMYPSLYDDVRGLGEQAAKGHFIIDLLRRGEGRSIESARNKLLNPQIVRYLTVTRSDYTPGGARIIRAFAGRVWYAGFSGEVFQGDARSPALSNFVMFSQLVKDSTDINKCYQEGDPTSREKNDIVDTDGGFIKIAGAETIVGMRPLGSSLIVFATNGVWEIQGGSDYGFSATNYKVTKVSAIGAFGEGSIVEEVGRLFFWAQDGIYVVAPNQMGSIVTESITQRTIQSLYEDLNTVTKENAVGAYDLFSKKVRWIYNTGEPFTDSSDSRELVLDTVLNAFYENSISTHNHTVELQGMFITNPFTVGTDTPEVMAGSELVMVDSDVVVVNQPVRESGLQSIKYFNILNIDGVFSVGISYYNNTEFRDWQSLDGVGEDAKAFLITGDQILGDSSIDKQIPYLSMHFRRTETGFDIDGNLLNPSGCLMRSQWDFANTAESKKWSPLVQTYRYNNPHLILNDEYDTGFKVITSKNKLRGRGRAFSIYMETEPYKDCRILGWNISINGNSIA